MRKNLQTAFTTRQYMISKDFEIYYYSDVSLSRVELHAHDYYECYMFLEGNVSMQAGRKIYPLKHGDIILIPPHQMHRAIIHNQDVPYRRFVFWLSREFNDYLCSLSDDYSYVGRYSVEHNIFVYHIEEFSFNTLQALVLRLIEELKMDRFGRAAHIPICVQDLVFMLNRIIYEQNNMVEQKDDDSLCQKLILYIENHLDESLTLEHLAQKFYTSKYHISHIFKDNFGLSVHQYIIKKRLTACREAIMANVSIKEAYLNYGFGDYSSFYRAFKKEYGISPRDFQELQQRNLEELRKESEAGRKAGLKNTVVDKKDI